jgi:succinate dehydrogenase/fumarate reductase flavoprotein subunit
MQILSTDILVVGAGLAGFTTAVRAAEKAAKVILTDKSNGAFGDGNILMASGSLRAGGKSPRTSSKELYESVMSEGVGYPDLVRAWSLTCGRALDWLISSGVKVNESAAGRVWIRRGRSRSRRFTRKMSVGARSRVSKNV